MSNLYFIAKIASLISLPKKAKSKMMEGIPPVAVYRKLRKLGERWLIFWLWQVSSASK